MTTANGPWRAWNLWRRKVEKDSGKEPLLFSQTGIMSVIQKKEMFDILQKAGITGDDTLSSTLYYLS